MLVTILLWVILVLACIPAMMSAWNVLVFRRLPRAMGTPAACEPVSVLIPARNEEASIGEALETVLASRGVDFEVVVLDDQSTDGTAGVVEAIAARDERLRLIRGEALPGGWCGKQYACDRLAKAAQHRWLLWLDADVRLSPDSLQRLMTLASRSEAKLISGFPRQRTYTWAESLVVPLIHVVLVGYLPIWLGRRWRHPAFAAGCGQMMLANREAYEQVGGHGAIRDSLHDGMTLPRAFRKRGYQTEIFDASDAASCRMYGDWRSVWEGFAKNATEGMATPVGIMVWTVLLLGAFVAPWLALLGWVGGLLGGGAIVGQLALASCGISLATSLLLAWRYGHDWRSVLGRPVGVAVLVAIQWYALARRYLGVSAGWKGRTYPAH